MKKFFLILIIVIVLMLTSVSSRNLAIKAGAAGEEKGSEGIAAPSQETAGSEEDEEQEQGDEDSEQEDNEGSEQEDPGEEPKPDEDGDDQPSEGEDEKPEDQNPVEDGSEEEKQDDNVIRAFSNTLPEGVRANLKYTQYLTSYDYVLITVSVGNVREKPCFNAKIIGNVLRYQRPDLLQEIRGEYSKNSKTDLWYKISWKDKSGVKEGYIFSTLGEARHFQFEKMFKAVKDLKGGLDGQRVGYINNYKNYNGKPPLYKGKSVDSYGYRADQSAPAFVKPDLKSEFRYLLDGMLVRIIGENKTFYKVKVPEFEGEYWVQRKYISFNSSIKKLTKAVVIDRKNQNEAVFEYINGGWVLLSYSQATTGREGIYSLLTPLGNFMAIEKRNKFWYYADGTSRIAGYCPYTVRFSAGGYIHGVPVDYIVKGTKIIDPGIIEYSDTIGTVPRSHMCVRNYTSHAKFIYDWIEIGKSAIIVIE